MVYPAAAGTRREEKPSEAHIHCSCRGGRTKAKIWPRYILAGRPGSRRTQSKLPVVKLRTLGSRGFFQMIYRICGLGSRTLRWLSADVDWLCGIEPVEWAIVLMKSAASFRRFVRHSTARTRNAGPATSIASTAPCGSGLGQNFGICQCQADKYWGARRLLQPLDKLRLRLDHEAREPQTRTTASVSSS